MGAFSVLVSLHTVVLVRCFSCLPFPVTTKCVPSLGLTFDHNAQVLTTSESFFRNGLQQAVYILSSAFDQPKSLFVVNFCGLLFDERKLRRKRASILPISGGVFDELFEFRPIIKSPACGLQDTGTLLTPDRQLFHLVINRRYPPLVSSASDGAWRSRGLAGPSGSLVQNDAQVARIRSNQHRP